MPYFQRPPLLDDNLPSSVAPALASAGASIVETATAIIDQETTTNAPMSPVVEAASMLGAPASALDPAELQRRASAALAALLEAFSSGGGVGPGLPLAASLPIGPGLPLGPAAQATKPLAMLPVIETDASFAAGDTASIGVPVGNDGTLAANLVLYSTDFVSDGGYQIPALQVTFSPRTLTLASRAQGRSEMKVAIPMQTGPGSYSALVQAIGQGRPCAVVVLRVK